ncbi:3-hydroxyacyl-CoA dehydrogenase NAD-binding domain-containing protein [Chelatococcus asaccharovorans]|uniref:Short chain enoyl-CoA hydratase /3-hydroxyacyl-CoA dehydrogenase n=1 Tax=Chelatococcus asaccharovorans TaxID=28210 RepID=A0A2V3TS50_9HYPH|nr:3-hydroxyacyl-CoA dehydrogenase NAD-binding domain-containing protein [Chelatococcus asaccharovorans]MBS7707989.1 enoyl-CoA hydratase/isomerase family protein [Chelatococcus asaccharovorans]PXW50535.1 short chain enoyl-CoA hydratase /3-hydroxyacyl-CoA dehydrogenase [Chelatococcus asaccharovorans]
MVRAENKGKISLVSIDNPPVNALNADVRQGLVKAVQAAAADPNVQAIVIASSGKTFTAGADIAEFGKLARPPSLPELIAALEKSPKPIVAAINGVALGGGLELALACHSRVASPDAKLGLPEVKLGLIPGSGGTQRLPRLIGAAAALQIMSSGEPVDAKAALSLGIVDAVAEGNLVETAMAQALNLARNGSWPLVSESTDRSTSEAREAFEVAAVEISRRAAEMPNVATLVELVRATFEMSFEEGLALEREQFLRLIADDRSKALRYVFFSERETARVPGLSRDTLPRPINRAAVIGAGTMGSGIAMCFANADIPVTVVETSGAALSRGMERIEGTYDVSVKRGTITSEEKERRIALIRGQVGLEAVGDADVVVEAVFEDMGVKKAIFSELDRFSRQGAILATNTSYLDINEIASATARPEDVVGLHFFSPANVMRLLEVVRTDKTAPDVVATALSLGRRLGKVPVVVGVCFGFVGNRMLARRTTAAERLLVDGALPHEVDAAVTQFGFRMGPFAMADLAGLDIGWRTRRSLGTKAAVADALCEAGRFGQKAGRGYYTYKEGDRTAHRDPEVEHLIEEVSYSLAVKRRTFTADEIIERLMYPMVNEGARILDERIAARTSDIDVIWLNGYNWPAWRGGPMYWADRVGLRRIAARLEVLSEESGDDSLEPARLLQRLASEERTFADLARERV